jgi:hypothetical protein
MKPKLVLPRDFITITMTTDINTDRANETQSNI